MSTCLTLRNWNQLKRVDVNELVKLAIHTVEPMAIQRNVRIHLDMNGSPELTADADEIEIIMNNLLSNAVKYNKEGGEVNVSIRNGGPSMTIKVEDTGIGISNEDKDKLFREFARIKTAETRDITGSGLGLSITKGMVEQYGGKIEVQSTPGQGSAFTVTLPVN